jgi:putative FmdB family regulatory protein
MPLYEYECDACGQRFEVIQQKFSDPPVEVCTACGKGPVRRLMSSPAIQFKGSGWYITDYPKKQRGPSEAPGSGGEKSESGGEKKAAESAAKSESKSTSPASPPATKAPATKE